MEMELLKDIMIIFGLSVAVILVFHRIKAPTIVGFLITGILAGPQGLGLIQASEQVGFLAEIGVVLLLFSVGIEISLKDLLRLKTYILVGGLIQVLLTLLAVFIILFELGEPHGEALLFGFLISLSSTAIVLRIIQKKDQFDSIYGRTTLGILIFQDIIIVPMMLITPLLPGALQTTMEPPIMILAKSIVLIILIILSAKWIIPQILFLIAKTEDRELFLLSMVTICFAVAWATSMAGLSLALGAFLAGLIISESPYSHQAIGTVLPLRDAFTSFFFISIGMFLDLNYLLQNPAYIVLVTLGVMALKAIISGLAVSIMGLPLRIAVLVSLALSQIGEFSFILSEVGYNSGLIPADSYQLFLNVAVLTMGATSFLIAASPKVADGVSRLSLPDRLRKGSHISSKTNIEARESHLVIIGYGVNGRNVARSAKMEGIPFVIIDMDPEIVKSERKRGEPIYYGDATQESVLQHTGIRKARVMVIAISDPVATRRIVEMAHRINPNLFIIVRTRYLEEMKPLHDLGASEVIPEEYETSVEIFSRVLEQYQIPREEIENFVAQVRADGYEMFRSLSKQPYCDSNIDQMIKKIRIVRVCKGSSISGRPIAELGLKEQGIILIAVNRDEKTVTTPDENFRLQVGDVVILLGSEERVTLIGRRFNDSGG